MIKAVIFDMDGLLLDTEKLLVKFWVQAAEEMGYPMKREQALYLRSLHRSFAIPYLKECFGDEFDYIAVRTRRMELMSAYLAKNPLETKKGAAELLKYLADNGIKSAVCTATDYERAKDYLSKVGLFSCFDRIISATMVEKGKPCPDIYLYACEQLELDPDECMALEDSPNGVRSAASAGCFTVMVPDLTQPDEGLMEIIWAKADSLADVIGLLKEL